MDEVEESAPTVSKTEEAGLNPESDLKKGLEALLKAMPDYEKGHRYYFGTEREKFQSDRLRAMLKGSENDFQVNLASRVVDAVTDALEISTLNVTTEQDGTPVSIETNNNSPSGSGSEVSQKLNLRVWHDNELDQEMPGVFKKAGYLGDCYLFVWGNPDDDEAVDIFMNSPTTCRVFYDEENPRLKKYAIKRWRTASGAVRVNLYYKDHLVKFVTLSDGRVRGERADEFRRMRPDEDEDIDAFGEAENPYGRVPFYHFRTDRPYGIPLHRNAYGPQDAITKLVQSQMTVTDFAAFPQRWALGETGIGTDGDEDWLEDGDGGTDPNDLESSFVSGPGRVWKLTGTKQVGQFQEANVEQILKPLDKFIELMSSSTGTPLTYLNKVRGTASTPLSGAAQRELNASHYQLVGRIKRAFAATCREAFSDALEILGHPDATVTIEWAETGYRDEKEIWEAALTQKNVGVTVRQILLERGYTEALVEEMGYTAEEPNGKAPEQTGDPFIDAQNAPVRPELKENNGKLPDQLHNEKVAKEGGE